MEEGMGGGIIHPLKLSVVHTSHQVKALSLLDFSKKKFGGFGNFLVKYRFGTSNEESPLTYVLC